MASYKIIAHLIDGDSTKSFRSIRGVADYVQKMEDMGEDGRRPWGFQTEYGQRYFVGFGWSQVEAEWNKAEITAKSVPKVLEISEDWMLCEYGYPVWAKALSVKLLDYSFYVLSVNGRHKVKVVSFGNGPDDYDEVTLGVYKNQPMAIDAIVRWAKLPELGFGLSIFFDIWPVKTPEEIVAERKLVPF